MRPVYVFLAGVVAVVFQAGRLDAQTALVANLEIVHSAHGHPPAGGVARMLLSADQTELAYEFEFFGLDLEPVAANRTDFNDIVGIHLHEIVPGLVGIHVLNVFGIPGEDDADLVVDYANETLTGRFDLTDASRDPITGELLPQFAQLTTKIIDDWVDNLLNNQLYFAVHSAGQGGGPILHGDVILVPEPASAAMALMALAVLVRKVRPRHWSSTRHDANV